MAGRSAFVAVLAVTAFMATVCVATITSTALSSAYSQYTTLYPSEYLAANADFGSATAYFGDDFAIVGAQNDRNQTGDVFVFKIAKHQNSTVSQTLHQKISPTQDVYVGANFGCAFSVAGNQLIIGAQYDRNNNGSVFVYTFNQSTTKFHLTQQLVAPDVHGPNDRARFFGSSIATAIDAADGGTHVTMVIGAASGNTSGKAYVYEQSDETLGVFALKHTLLNTFGMGSNFAQSVAISRSGWVAVGINHAFNTSGAVALYNLNLLHGKTVKVWSRLLFNNSLPTGCYFGSQLALQDVPAISGGGAILSVSAPWYKNGAAYLYTLRLEKGTAILSNLATAIEPHFAQPWDAFGCSVLMTSASTTSDSVTRFILFYGAWGNKGGSISAYILDVLPSTTAEQTLKLTDFPAASLHPFTKPVYFGSSIAATSLMVPMNVSAATSVDAPFSILVGAFAAFDDKGGAFVF